MRWMFVSYLQWFIVRVYTDAFRFALKINGYETSIDFYPVCTTFLEMASLRQFCHFVPTQMQDQNTT